MNPIANSIDELSQQQPVESVVTPITNVADSFETPFPVEGLPPGMREIVTAVSAAERTPPGIAACCALGIISATVGPQLRIKSLPNKLCPANLFIIVAAESGGNKTETFRPIAAPLLDFEFERIQKWKETSLNEFQAEKILVESKIKKFERKIISSDKSPHPLNDLLLLKARLRELAIKCQTPRLVSENVTSEKLQILLAENHAAISSISSDGREVVDVICGRYRNKGTDEGLYLKGYALEPYSSDRVTRESIAIKETWISVLWLFQPDKLAELLSSRSLSDGGLLPRFLIYLADFKPTPIDRSVPEIDPAILTRWDKLVKDLLVAYRLRTDLRILASAPGVTDLMDAHYNSILVRRCSDLQEVRSYAARWNEQAWRLCLVLHAAQFGEEAHTHEVSVDTAKAAIAIADWFAHQQLAILGWSKESAEKSLFQQVLALAESKSDEGVKAADVYRARIVPDAAAARELLTKMEEADLLTVTRIPSPRGGGWQSETYHLP